MWLIALLVGCVVRVDGGAAASFDPGEPAHPQGQTNLGLGIGRGAGLYTLNLQTRPSARGMELALAPEVCLRDYSDGIDLGFGGCAGLTLIGGGKYEGRRTVLFGGPYADLHGLAQIAETNSGMIMLRLGARGGLDVRTLGPSPSPFVGGYLGVEIWFLPVPME
jgi:hypothetical protein